MVRELGLLFSGVVWVPRLGRSYKYVDQILYCRFFLYVSIVYRIEVRNKLFANISMLGAQPLTFGKLFAFIYMILENTTPSLHPAKRGIEKQPVRIHQTSRFTFSRGHTFCIIVMARRNSGISMNSVTEKKRKNIRGWKDLSDTSIILIMCLYMYT